MGDGRACHGPEEEAIILLERVQEALPSLARRGRHRLRLSSEIGELVEQVHRAWKNQCPSEEMGSWRI